MPKWISKKRSDTPKGWHLYPHESVKPGRDGNPELGYPIGPAYCGALPDSSNPERVHTLIGVSRYGSIEQYATDSNRAPCDDCQWLAGNGSLTDPEWQENFRRRVNAEVSDA